MTSGYLMTALDHIRTIHIGIPGQQVSTFSVDYGDFPSATDLAPLGFDILCELRERINEAICVTLEGAPPAPPPPITDIDPETMAFCNTHGMRSPDCESRAICIGIPGQSLRTFAVDCGMIPSAELTPLGLAALRDLRESVNEAIYDLERNA